MVELAIRNVDRSAPWSALGSWTRDFDQLFNEMDGMLVPFRSTRNEGLKPMTCDIHESESAYMLSLDIPGVSKEEIDVEFSGNHVTVSAERKQENTVKDVTTHRVERSFGVMQRTFALPEGVEADKIQANYENGVLYLAIPKAEAAKPKRIEISSGKSGFLQKIKEKALDTQAKKVSNS